ncbi:MAG: hypothetical protein E4H03_03525 [Myxococcales bacterium]|nr:MAG: hypothetical protein E4H03_03525 [Myxococcales bacterium]
MGRPGKYIFRDSRFEIPDAAGITALKIAEVSTKGIAKIKFKGKKMTLREATDDFRLSVSLLFGADPSTEESLTARYLPCEPTTKKNTCRR